MIKKSNGKIGTRELSALIFIVIAIKGADSTPHGLFIDGLTATWMFPIIWLIVMALPFMALLKLLQHYKRKNIVQIIYHLTGKYFGFLLALILFFLQFMALILNSRGYVDIMVSRFYILTPMLVIYSALILSSYFVATRGYEGLARTSYLILPYLIIAMLLLPPLLWADFSPLFLHPVAGPGVKEIITGGVKHSSLIGEYMIFALFYPYTKDHKTFRNANIIGFVFGCILISLLLAEYIMLFDYVAVQKMLHPFSQLTRHTEIMMFINNLDALFLGVWIIVGIIRFALYLYGTAGFYGYTFKLKEFEPLILPFAILTIIIGFIPYNASMTSIVLRQNYLIEKSWLYFFFLPLLLWGIAKVKGEFKHERT
ncbi:GerAB/ArcD/ProY family transporter [Haloplasma contractile]|nr:GerAB/ArcD/ProY family transporter [Haloplasma contractile]